MNTLFFYESISGKMSTDFAITLEGEGYIKDCNLAYIEPFCFDSLEKAKVDMTLYQHRKK